MEQKELLWDGYRENKQGTIIEYTSGSTGVPLRLVRIQAEIMQNARILWALRMDIFPQVMETLGIILFPITQNRHQTSSLRKKGNVLFSTLNWQIDHIEAYLEELDVLKPSWLSDPLLSCHL